MDLHPPTAPCWTSSLPSSTGGGQGGGVGQQSGSHPRTSLPLSCHWKMGTSQICGQPQLLQGDMEDIAQSVRASGGIKGSQRWPFWGSSQGEDEVGQIGHGRSPEPGSRAGVSGCATPPRLAQVRSRSRRHLGLLHEERHRPEPWH